MDLTEAIIICEISFHFMSLVLVFVIDVCSVIYFDSFVDLCNYFDILIPLCYYFMLQCLGCLKVLCFIKYILPMMFFQSNLFEGRWIPRPCFTGRTYLVYLRFPLTETMYKLRRLLNYCLLVFLFSIVFECLIYCLQFVQSTSWNIALSFCLLYIEF